MAPHCPWHDLRSFALLFAFEYFLDCLKYQGVGPFYCIIGLRVINRCEGDLCLTCWQKSLNIVLSKYSALSIVIYQGILYQQMICHKNFLMVAELTFMIGIASTHFVKYLTATMAKV
jgi:hypothetical protein